MSTLFSMLLTMNLDGSSTLDSHTATTNQAETTPSSNHHNEPSTTPNQKPNDLSADRLLAIQQNVQNLAIEASAKSNTMSNRAHSLNRMTRFLNMV